MFRSLVFMAMGLLAINGCQGPKAYRSIDHVTESSVVAQADEVLENASNVREVHVAASDSEKDLHHRAGGARSGVIRPVTFTDAADLVDAPMEMTGPAEEIAPSRSSAQALTLEELESLALSANPAVGEAEARVQAARGTYVQVGLAPNPVAGYQAGEIGDDGTAGQQGGFVSQQFVRGNKLGLNREVAA